MDNDEDMNERLHGQQLAETGFWGREGAGCLFMTRDTGRLCVAYRSEFVLEPHTWGTWGGALDVGETPVQAVLREVGEEAGQRGPRLILPLAVFSHSSGFRYHNFLVVVDSEFDPELNSETQDSTWCELQDIPSPKHPGLVYLLERSGARIARLIEQRSLLPPCNDDPTEALTATRLDSPEFSTWFDASKIVDDRGRPVLVFHGGKVKGDAFDERATFFTNVRATAEQYAKRAGPDGRVTAAYLAIKNPKVYDFLAPNTARWYEQKRGVLSRQGFDGMLIGGNTFVAFRPDQIRVVPETDVALHQVDLREDDDAVDGDAGADDDSPFERPRGDQ